MLGTAINELPPFGKDITRLANNELTQFVWHKAPLEVPSRPCPGIFLTFVYKNLSKSPSMSKAIHWYPIFADWTTLI